MSEQTEPCAAEDRRSGTSPIPTLTGIVILVFIVYQVLFGQSPSRFGLDGQLEKILKMVLGVAMLACLLGIVICYFARARRKAQGNRR